MCAPLLIATPNSLVVTVSTAIPETEQHSFGAAYSMAKVADDRLALVAAVRLGDAMPQWRVDLEAFELVLLRAPENTPAYDDAELKRIQAEHLATWSRTSVASLLPARQPLNDPALTGIYAQSGHSVYAIANGNLQDEGGPTVILHWNGSAWSKVAQGQFGFGVPQQLSSDGHGGLWLPMPGFDGQKSYLVHYSNGHLTTAALPVGASSISLDTVSLIPGGTGVLAAGETHGRNAPGTDVVAVVLQYGA